MRSIFDEHHIQLFELPINMTDYLQPVDIVPNGPIKAHIRSARARQLFNYLQGYNCDYQAAKNNRNEKGEPAPLAVPKYAPPAPTMAQGITIVSEIFAVQFQTQQFQESIRAFTAAGTYMCVRARAPPFARARITTPSPTAIHAPQPVLVARQGQGQGEVVPRRRR